MRLSSLRILPLLAGLAAAGPLLAQPAPTANYPSKPVVVIIPFTPGSVAETEGRVHFAEVSRSLRQQFLFDFKPGGASTIGMAHVARQPADGYTLLLVSASYSLIPLRTLELPFDKVNAFAPISLVSKRWGVILVHPSMPSTAAEFTAYAKANPGKVNLATNGVGSQQHLTGAWMEDLLGIKLTFVHYKSAAQVIPDLLAGRVQVNPITLSSALPHLRSGKLKTLGMANHVRNPAFPDMPTLVEQGWKDFEYSSWQGLVAPAKTPPAIINLLSAEMAKAVKSPEVVKRLASETQLIGSTPEEFARHVVTETERWRKMTRESGITLDD